MPFGYKNGPTIFQRVMQNILAPFLWIFALVYIDDIVIFTLTFEDHISHLDQVFKAIEKSGVTLAVTNAISAINLYYYLDKRFLDWDYQPTRKK